MFRKRKSASSETTTDTAASAAKKPRVDDGGAAAAAAAAAVASQKSRLDEECVDDKELVKKSTMIVRLTTQPRNAPPSSVIVIEDSDEEENASSDIKPNIDQLNEILPEQSAASDTNTSDCKPPATTTACNQSDALQHHTAPDSSSCEATENVRQIANQKADGSSSDVADSCSTSQGEVNSNQPVPQSADGDDQTAFRSSSQRRSSKSRIAGSSMDLGESSLKSSARPMQPEICMQDVCIQTDGCSNLAEQQLESLRSNVLQLLKTIVPSLTCGNLEFVDELVVEMVRVNNEVDD